MIERGVRREAAEEPRRHDDARRGRHQLTGRGELGHRPDRERAEHVDDHDAPRKARPEKRRDARDHRETGARAERAGEADEKELAHDAVLAATDSRSTPGDWTPGLGAAMLRRDSRIMIVAVTGATGFVGKRLVAQLIAAGHEVVALTRSRADAERRLPVRCRLVEWNPDAGRIEAGALEGLDAVVNLAGAGVADGRWTAKRKDLIRRSRVEATRLLVDTMAALPADRRPRVLVSASAIGFYGDRGDEIVTEQSPGGAGFLADVCRAWEAAARAAETHGIRTVVVRIGVVLGRDGGALARMLPPFRLGLGGRIGSGRQWMSWVHLDDLVALVAFAIERQDVQGVLNAVAPAPTANADFVATLGRVLGRPTLLPVPSSALQLALGEMAGVLLEGQHVLPAAAEAYGFRFRHPQLAGALVDVTADPSTMLETEQWVPRPPEEVFPFFADALNLERLTPPFLKFRILKVSTPVMQTGTRIDYQLSLHGIPVRWQSLIGAWNPNRSFVDSQTRGPYQRWDHTHEFEPYRGGTILRDRVHYELPLGALGGVVAGAFVAGDLEKIFAFRRAAIREIFT